MWLGGTHKTPSIFISISQSHNPLTTPKKILAWRLIHMQKGIIPPRLIVPPAIHKAKPIKGSFDFIFLPQLLKDRFALPSQLPLGFWMTDVLDHAAVEHGGVVLPQDLRLGLGAVQAPVRQQLHYVPELGDVFLACAPGQIVFYHHKAILG
jgi:hypothetical protein